MRKILFRGKQVQGDCWVYGFLIQNINNFYILINTKIGCVYRLIKPETVGQHTGITDKNSKKIFNGDILKVTDCKRKKTYITKVCTYFNTLCVNPNGKCYEFTPIGFENAIWDYESYEVEIIGNIHDNPELLKGIKNV